ncbi:MAG: aryl-sulfate sulfotransferase, partial [Chitinophagaceae bacterium]|nr:aryl-sulfate sulfotransferase [Chitinophagaceae bacterium]
MAQIAILPGGCDTLNYTQVLFEMPYQPGATVYEIIITSKDNPAGNISAKTGKHYFIATSGLHFNNTYHWQYNCYDGKGTKIYTSPTGTLHIQGTWQADSNRYRNRIIVNDSLKITPGYILLDNGSIMNREGEVLWTFPKGKFGTVRDLEFTKEGTLTFLWDGHCYETDLRGNILWRSPDSALGYKLTDYHHEFTKLDNGNYLCMARRIIPGDNSTVFSIVFETDKHGNTQWLWDEKQYYSHETNFAGSHLNAAYYDAKEKRLYVSNRDLNSIARINTHKAMIEYSLGYDYHNSSITTYYPQDEFGRQHAVSMLDNSDLLLFNNNYPGKTSSVIIMSQPMGKIAPEVKWEYIFHF